MNDGSLEDPDNASFKTVEDAKAYYIEYEKNKIQWVAERVAAKDAEKNKEAAE